MKTQLFQFNKFSSDRNNLHISIKIREQEGHNFFCFFVFLFFFFFVFHKINLIRYFVCLHLLDYPMGLWDCHQYSLWHNLTYIDYQAQTLLHLMRRNHWKQHNVKLYTYKRFFDTKGLHSFEIDFFKMLWLGQIKKVCFRFQASKK